MRVLTIDAENCTGCRMCELACSSFKEGEFIPERSRIRVVADALEGWSRPAVCLQCEDPMCMAVCPVQAISKKKTPEGDHVVVVNAKTCIACGRCVVACPFGAITLFPKSKAIKCDLCGGSPRCVEFCFYGCLHFVELTEAEYVRRTRKITALTNKSAREIAKREPFERRAAFSLEASRVTPGMSHRTE